MKFFDGWSPKAGMHIFQALRMEEGEQRGETYEAWICLDKERALHRAVDGTMMTVQYSFPAAGVARVKMQHHTGNLPKMPDFLQKTDGLKADVEETEGEIQIEAGEMTLRLKKGEGFQARFFWEGKLIAETATNKMAYIRDGEQKTYIKEEMKTQIGEYVYGFGERFTPFVKNGQSVDIFNMNGGTNTDQVYKNIPFYISNKGYGMLVNDSGRVSYEICSENVENIQFSVEGEELEYCIIAGPGLHDVLRRYTSLTGRPALPPAWTFGLWLTTSFTTDYDEETVTGFIDGMKQRELPLEVFHFDCFWMKGGRWCNFRWDTDSFPDPEGMLKRLKKRGLKICLWINPYIAQRSELFDIGKERGYFIRNQKGGVWQTDTWQPGMAIVDFTNPEAWNWYQEELRRLIHMGADCFKTDFGERIPTDGVYFDGSDPEKMHNYYTLLYNKCVFEVLTEELGEGRASLFARSATVGGQCYPVHWGGDNEASYLSMAESLRGGLSLCSCGFGFWSHDISGFGNTATPDLYKRWTAFGMLSTHSRLHGNSSYRVPWLFDEEAVEVLRFFTNLKCSLMPYLYRNAVETHETGIPMMRPMVMEYQDDANCAFLDRQYFLGDAILVAPIFNEEGMAEYYLPAGTWTNLITNRRYQGGCWVKEHHGYMSIPVLTPENTILAIGKEKEKVEYAYHENVTFHIFEMKDGGMASTCVYTADGKKRLAITCVRSNDKLEIQVEGTGSWNVCLRNIETVVSVTGARIGKGEYGLLLEPENSQMRIQVIIESKQGE